MEIILITTMMETALIVILLGVFFIARFVLIKKKAKRIIAGRPEDNSIVAKAIVLSVEQAVTTVKTHARMKILVQVMPVKGRNFVIELKETLSAMELSTIRTGSTVSVKYNPDNTKDVKLVKAA